MKKRRINYHRRKVLSGGRQIEINTENLIITDINTLGIGYEKFPIQNTIIHSIKENGVKWIDLYTIVENIETREKKKMKIRIDGGSFSFSDVSEKEWEEMK